MTEISNLQQMIAEQQAKIEAQYQEFAQENSAEQGGLGANLFACGACKFSLNMTVGPSLMAFFAIRKGVITNADSIVWFITKTCGISELAALGILNSAFGTGLSAYEGTQAAIEGLCKEMGSCG